MSEFNMEKASADELWDYCMEEYNSTNAVTGFLFNNFYKALEKNLSILKPSNRVLEVGCGAGESCRRILDILDNQHLEKLHFEASEFDQRYVDKLWEHEVSYKVIQESVYEMKRKDNSFDCILLLEVLEHLEDYELALKEIFRVSSQYVIISVPHEPWWRILNILRGKYLKDFGNTPDHHNHWGPIGLKKLVSKYGKVKQTSLPIPWLMLVAEVPKPS